MTNKTYSSTEQFRVELEPSSTLKAKDANAIKMQDISHGNNYEGELTAICMIKKLSLQQFHCMSTTFRYNYSMYSYTYVNQISQLNISKQSKLGHDH